MITGRFSIAPAEQLCHASRNTRVEVRVARRGAEAARGGDLRVVKRPRRLVKISKER